MILRIDFDSEIPIYVQVKNQVIEGIAKGEIEKDEELPSVRALAEDIGINMHTVNKAYNILKEEGYIKIDRRKGAVVSLNLNNSNDKFKEDLNENLYYYMAECFNRGIEKDEIKKYIDKVFLDFNKEEGEK
ncbi:MAG: GntR family transcriptional regulator [Clostridium sp.]|jgi:transcriptional regulator|uniref:GntR family transcriptional regulator n=1 Tax=uncultured Clostridium sp. TaxID=59620 RepID=UPI0025FA1E50|nr:GntR family transcriptional regulator [uncultured Clostridium sp.]MCI6692213.1 GntR family transcriptional regulator [Clostridium sp.]